MKKVHVFAVLAFAAGLFFSCTSDIETAEEVLDKLKSSSSSISSSSSSSNSSLSSSSNLSSSSSLQIGNVWCIIGSNCMETAQSICDYLGTQVPACP